MQKTILSFGETLWDLLPEATTLGGAPFNFAYRVDGLGDNGVMVSRLGRDELGRRAFEKIRRLGMDTTFIQWDERHPTGTVRVSFDEANRPDYLILPDVAYDHIGCHEALLDVAGEADCFCFGTLTQRSPTTRDTLYRLLRTATDAVKLLDINLRKRCYDIETVTASLEKADILKLNDDETAQLAGMLQLPGGPLDRIAEQLVGRYRLACCVITLGERGALAISGGAEKLYSPGFRVDPVDSLGCGDAFAAGFIHEHLRGAPLLECCRYGNAIGAAVACQQGATMPLDKQNLEQFLSSASGRNFDPTLTRFAVEEGGD